MKLEIDISQFNFQKNLLGGQSFTWIKEDEKFVGITKNKIIFLEPTKSGFKCETYPQDDDTIFIQKYFRLNENYDQIIENFKHDPFFLQANQQIPGIRLLNQEIEVVIFSFILATAKNVNSIKKCVLNLIDKLGEKITIKSKTYRLFPTTEAIAKVPIEVLLETGAGFRAKYLKSTAQRLLNDNFDFEIESEEKVKQYLLSLDGIGPKVADCIMLFGLAYDHRNPIDVWGYRILEKWYKQKNNKKYEDHQTWFRDYFGEKAGWAGHVLFEYARENPNLLK
ncbi:MAG: 8-oxoguanine DNA glycosylase [Candidatus Dojkabacteria bacterium]|nr:MAG: 8-oxoguanine DNA glycosylase [Candidatus Dojkabacteria bacterium]